MVIWACGRAAPGPIRANFWRAVAQRSTAQVAQDHPGQPTSVSSGLNSSGDADLL
jgi:hypothetical protein